MNLEHTRVCPQALFYLNFWEGVVCDPYKIQCRDRHQVDIGVEAAQDAMPMHSLLSLLEDQTKV